MVLNDDGLDLLFRKARTQNGWLDRPVSDDTGTVEGLSTAAASGVRGNMHSAITHWI